jgi:hypothetical protein
VRVGGRSCGRRAPPDTGDLWDSGKVESDQSIHVEYQGKSLESCKGAVENQDTSVNTLYQKRSLSQNEETA